MMTENAKEKGTFYKTALVVAILATLGDPGQAHAFGRSKSKTAQPKPYLMAALGDSISAGAIANLPRPTQWDSSTRLPQVGSFLAAAPGDPNGVIKYVENKDTYSWSTGRSIDSHYIKLRDYLWRVEGNSANLEALNAAVSGSNSKDIPGQAQQVLQAMQSGKYRELRYVTLLVGANDLCTKAAEPGLMAEEELLGYFRQIFGTLAQVGQTSPIRVLVGAVPQIPELAQPDVAEAHTLGGLSCRMLRDETIKACTSMMNWQSASDLAGKMAAVDRHNALLAKTVAQMNQEFPQIEAAFATGSYDYVPLKEDLAADCFHPNVQGQEKLSERLWVGQSWFR